MQDKCMCWTTSTGWFGCFGWVKANGATATTVVGRTLFRFVTRWVVCVDVWVNVSKPACPLGHHHYHSTFSWARKRIPTETQCAVGGEACQRLVQSCARFGVVNGKYLPTIFHDSRLAGTTWVSCLAASINYALAPMEFQNRCSHMRTG